MRESVQGFPAKEESDARLLKRVLRYALERSALNDELSRLKSQEQQRAEISSLRCLEAGGPEGHPSLRETKPSQFCALVRRYEALLDLAVERRIFKRELSTLRGAVRGVARDLAQLGAGPSDIVNVHNDALRNKLVDQPELRGQLVLQESRVVLLEAMGFVMQHYRDGGSAH